MESQIFEELNETEIQRIAAHEKWAAEVLRTAFHEDVPLDRNAAEVLDVFVEGLADAIKEDDEEMGVQVLGAFLGQSMVAELGGNWVKVRQGFALQLENGKMADVFGVLGARLNDDKAPTVLEFWDDMAA